MKDAISKGIAHVFNSKTNGLIIIALIMGLITVIVAAAFFSVSLWDQWFQQGIAGIIAAALRAIGVDGVPKAAAAWQNPNSAAANPPPAVTEVQPSTIQTMPPPIMSPMLPPNYGERPPL